MDYAAEQWIPTPGLAELWERARDVLTAESAQRIAEWLSHRLDRLIHATARSGGPMQRSIGLLATFVYLTATGCIATVGGYKKQLDRMVGSDISTVMESWGPPAQTYRMPNGSTLYTWVREKGAVAFPVGNAVYARQRGCTTTLTVDSTNRIQSWQFEGNACEGR